jgi:hypothetical protein
MAVTAEIVQPTKITDATFYEALGAEVVDDEAKLEQQAQQGLWHDGHESSLGQVIAIAEQPADIEARKHAERLIHRASSLALQETVRVDTISETSRSRSASLLEAAKRSRKGDTTARKVVETNVLTDLIERSIKAGHVLSVKLEVNDENKIMQYGQLMDDVHVNALRFASEMPQMRDRAKAETRNGARIELAQQHGLLKDYCFVVFSRYPDNMSEADAGKVGFFTETKSCAIQVTTFKDGHLVTESAFVAGVKQPGAVAHDGQVISALAATYGHNLSDKNATEIIDSPILIHKSLMQNGVIDLVRKYDDLAGGTFFGERKPRQSYESYVKMCSEREASLSTIVENISNQLVSESQFMSHPLEATRRLHKLSQQQMVDFAISNGYINARVFGATAAAHIEDARFWLERGQYDRYSEARNMAQSTARSSSCPTSEQLGIDDPQDGESGNNRTEAEQSGEKKMMNCPFCGAKVWGDPCAKVLKCWDCNACAKDGKVVNSGDGGHRARAERAAAEAEALAAERRAAVATQVDAAFEEMHEEAVEEPAVIIGAAKPDLAGVS